MGAFPEPNQEFEPAKRRAAQARFFRFNRSGGHLMTRAEPSAPSSVQPTRDFYWRDGRCPVPLILGTTRRSSLQCLFRGGVGDGHDAFGASFGEVDPLVIGVGGLEFFFVPG